MRRLLATAAIDVRLQVRHGFYYATAFLLALWAFIATQLPPIDLAWLLPAVMAENILINTFYFIGALVLLEKGEGTLDAQVVTPLRTWEYLASKVGTLTLLSVAENVAVAALLVGARFNIATLVAGIILTSVLYVLVGFGVVARYRSINEYLLPSVGYTTVLTLPLVPYLAGWEHWLLYLHPLQGVLLLLRAAFAPVEGWQVVYGALYAAAWIGLAFAWSRRTFVRFVTATAGS